MAEQDQAVQHADLSLGNEKDGALLLKVWDFAGQRIFQAVLNMFLIRYGIVNLVFNLELLCDLPDENAARVKGALNHLGHWLSTLLMFVPRVPIIIIGTHAGKKASRNFDKQKEISVHLENLFEQLLKRLNVKRNEAENLLFFSVENSDPKDENIPRLRTLIEKTVVEDVVPDPMGRSKNPISYVKFATPLSWTRIADKMQKLVFEEGVLWLKLYPSSAVAVANDTEAGIAEAGAASEKSFLDICRDFGATSDCTDNESVKERIRVILALFHQFGVVWYRPVEEVGANNFLEDVVILKPQWVLEHITYIVRCVLKPTEKQTVCSSTAADPVLHFEFCSLISPRFPISNFNTLCVLPLQRLQTAPLKKGCSSKEAFNR